MSKRSIAGSIWTTPDQYHHKVDPTAESGVASMRPSMMIKAVAEVQHGIDDTHPTNKFKLKFKLKCKFK